jgi:hypothetical protein
MTRDLFGFKPANLSVVEFFYKSNLTLDGYYILVSRKDYPCPIYIKIGLDNEIREMYPLFIDSMEKSVDIIKNRIPYKGTYDFSKFSYISWDMKSDPVELYIPNTKNLYIARYKNGDVNSDYYGINDLNELDNHEDLTSEIKDFVRKENPDKFIYGIENGKIKKIINMFDYKNKRYMELREKIPAFRDIWL